jgi:hypothetical protein
MVMKFRIGFVVGAVALGLSLVSPPAATASPSVVAAAADPYPRTVKTVCHARALKNPYRAGKKERFRIAITENSTDMPRVRLSYSKQRKVAGGGYKTVGKLRPKRFYHGKPVNLPFQTSRAGRFRIVVKTDFGPKSQFRNCRDGFTFRVAGAGPLPSNDNGNGNGNGNGSGELPSTGAKQDN